MMKKLILAATMLLGLCGATFAESPVPESMISTVNKGDVAWVMTATLLVIFMVIPGLALFYGGLVRAKNMLSVLVQIIVVFSLVSVLWIFFGYSFAFTEGNAMIGSASKVFLQGVTLESLANTFTSNVKLPEYTFIAFQGTFAGITCALIVGAFAERIRFSAVLIFTLIWFSLCYLPVCHMVWGPGGYLLGDGALDFAGGTVVHINAGIAGLVGAYMVGKRVGLGREAMAPHSLALTMVGAAMLWVGWFGFNAGSNLEANSGAGLAFINTLAAGAAGVLSWSLAEGVLKGKSSMLGAASGAVSGLVVITPACGTVGPMGAIVMGLIAGVMCLWGVNGMKRLFKADDTLDVFGIHGWGGIIGALLTAVFSASTLGGTKGDGYEMGHQLLVQIKSVLVTVGFSGVVSILAYKIADLSVGLRVPEEQEREGLDISSHGETAYNY